MLFISVIEVALLHSVVTLPIHSKVRILRMYRRIKAGIALLGTSITLSNTHVWLGLQLSYDRYGLSPLNKKCSHIVVHIFAF